MLPKLHSFFAVSPTGMQVRGSPLSKITTLLQVGLIELAIAMDAELAASWRDWVFLLAVPLVAATTWWSGFQYYRRNPFQDLVSVGVTRTAERLMGALNLVMVLGGFGLSAFRMDGGARTACQPQLHLALVVLTARASCVKMAVRRSSVDINTRLDRSITPPRLPILC
jgi:hypothetical protein